MTGAGLPPLLLLAAVATATPGGATMLAAASGGRWGVRRSLPLVAGMACGLALLMGVAGAGLGAALDTLPALRPAVRLGAVLWLLLLAWRIARAGPPRGGDGAPPAGFAAGAALNAVNPKAWAMALTAAGGHAGVAEGPGALALILAAVFGVAALLALLGWCWGGSLLARLLRRPWHWHAFNAALGAALAASALAVGGAALLVPAFAALGVLRLLAGAPAGPAEGWRDPEAEALAEREAMRRRWAMVAGGL